MKAEETCQSAVSEPVQEQRGSKGWLSGRKVSVGEKTTAYLAQRFQGDGVRYKAKLIGVDEVPHPEGDKMCWDSMMKLKGQEAAARARGQHKQRIWLKVSDTCVRIVDERTGVVEHEQDLARISSVKKDDSEPRAFSYIYGHEGTFTLFFVKMANQADPVIEDLKDAFRFASDKTSEATLTQNGVSLLLEEQVEIPHKVRVFVRRVDCNISYLTPDNPSTNVTSCEDDLLSIFTDSSGTARPLSPTLDLSKTGSQPHIAWASQTPSAFLVHTLGAAPFNPPTAWSQAGHPTIPSPTSLGSWSSAGPWDYQPVGSAWGQSGMVPQAAIQPSGMWTQAGGLSGHATPGYFAAAGSVPISGDVPFPRFSVPSTCPPQPVQLQSDPKNAYSVFSSSYLEN